MRSKAPESNEALQGALELLVLQTLQSGPLHGYGVSQAIRRQSNDLLAVETGSLYPALHRLERRGFIRSEWKKSEKHQRVKQYRITAAGKKRLANGRSRWVQLTAAIGKILQPQE